ncbi:MAG: hypothetical protein WCJ64_14815 [Rhodospirillaceae bacterium]
MAGSESLVYVDISRHPDPAAAIAAATGLEVVMVRRIVLDAEAAAPAGAEHTVESAPDVDPVPEVPEVPGVAPIVPHNITKIDVLGIAIVDPVEPICYKTSI